MSWVGALLIIIGYICVIYKRRIGFLTQLAGCLLMIFLYYDKDGGVILVNSVFAVINVLGFFKWGGAK